MKVAMTRSETIVHINEAVNGRACDCICVECGDPVVARQGPIRDWHFAHDAGMPPCAVNPESLLHRFVKQVIFQERAVKVPPLPPQLSVRYDRVSELICQGWLNFDSTFEELWLEGRRPDVVGVLGDDKVLIEVAYTHSCDDNKIKFLDAKGWLTLEIDVSCFGSDDFEPSTVRHWLQTDIQKKQWLVPFEPVAVPAAPAAPSGPTLSPPVPTAVAPKSSRPELLLTVIIEGRPVTLKRMPFGDLALQCQYGEEAVKQVRHIAKRFGGRFKMDYKNWLIPACFEQDVTELLNDMHNEASLWAGK